MNDIIFRSKKILVKVGYVILRARVVIISIIILVLLSYTISKVNQIGSGNSQLETDTTVTNASEGRVNFDEDVINEIKSRSI